jgi:hypothetical protein
MLNKSKLKVISAALLAKKRNLQAVSPAQTLVWGHRPHIHQRTAVSARQMRAALNRH